jgi:hypothetical protein
MRVLTASELPAPDVAFEACTTFAADAVETEICTGCGWLLDEHRRLDAAA